jgi:hypothetical protein
MKKEKEKQKATRATQSSLGYMRHLFMEGMPRLFGHCLGITVVVAERHRTCCLKAAKMAPHMSSKNNKHCSRVSFYLISLFIKLS